MSSNRYNTESLAGQVSTSNDPDSFGTNSPKGAAKYAVPNEGESPNDEGAAIIVVRNSSPTLQA